jgi:hypothetical protein
MFDFGDLKNLKYGRGPFTTFSLIAILLAGILSALSLNATGTDKTILIVGIMFIFFTIIFFIGSRLPKKIMVEDSLDNEEYFKLKFRHDVFLSSPMAAFEDNDRYIKEREFTNCVIECFKNECGFSSIFYAGKEINNIEDFELEEFSIERDLDACRESKYFALIWPEKLASSVLVEAGWAIALNKPSVYFVKNRKELPFLLRTIDQACKNVRICDYQCLEGILKKIKSHKESLFPQERFCQPNGLT